MSDQHPQSETVDLLPGVPATVRRGERRPSHDADAGTERRVHGHDVCGILALWPVRRVGPRSHRDPAEGDDLAAPRLRRRLCRAGRKAGVRGALSDPEIKKAGSRPAALVNMLDLVTGARAERGPTRA